MLIKYGVNHHLPPYNSVIGCLVAPSSILRRQQFLVRILGGFSSQTYQNRVGGIRSVAACGVEADAESILRAITPALESSKHKGQAGKIAVVGGCREYTGAPYFAAISALKIGADLSHVFCTKDAAPVIKGYSPELIVHPILEESYSIRDEDKSCVTQRVLAEIDKWLERFDCLVVGPGLGRDPFLLDCVNEIIKRAQHLNVPIIVDGDGLFLVTNCLDLVSGYPLAVLTPNVNEYKRLIDKVLNCEVNDREANQQVQFLAKQMGGITILRKGKSDLISDGDIVKSVSTYGSPRRCGGQGDILSGSVLIMDPRAKYSPQGHHREVTRAGISSPSYSLNTDERGLSAREHL
ncbi:hypothetical protein SAY86_017448 [Trapa natans]|uniref:ATP-dependent (S)-NAD(P)H-hydrate dehydratase n=1 Tax=Trapa natans TaxID=22666 RepID=A0AAN7R2Q3_TRANT|nr:hypothetical protein SAY86_017448 [Trapa natans]